MINQQGDRQVLAQLAHYGSNLSKPHLINFYLYFTTKEVASRAAIEMRQEGYTVQVQPSPEPWWKRPFVTNKWCCFAQKTLVPTEDAIFQTTDFFNKVAKKYHGEYDGWEAPITK